MVSIKPVEIKKRKEKTNKHQVKDKIKKKSKGGIVNAIEKTSKKKKTAVMSVIQDKTVAVQKKKCKFIMPSKYITESIVESCLNALDQVAACTSKKNAIFEDEQKIFAEINSIKIQTSNGNVKFVLPHSTAASTGEICLITPDIKKGKKIDHEPTIDHWEEILKKADVSCVKTVLPLRQLKVEYDQYELKRRLLTQHDFIMVDTRILNHASHILGKKFFKKHNMLIPVKINEKSKDVKKCIDIGLRSTMLRLAQGPTAVILVGHTGMPKNHLKENVMSLVEQLQNRYPGGEANIRSIALKLPLSLSIPLYLTLRPSSSINNPPKLRMKKPKHFKDVEDELSTMPNTQVRVAPDGTVTLIKKKSSKIDGNQTDEEEEEASDNNEESE